MTTEEREQKEQRIRDLTCDLKSPVSDIGDYKVIKCYEAQLVGEELPYNMEELHEKRQAARDEINALQQELAADED